MIYGSSMTDPNYANYGGMGLTPTSSQTDPYAANYQGRMTTGLPTPNVSIGGQVLGADTGGGGSYPTAPSAPSAPSQPSAQDQAQQAYFSMLDQQAGGLSGQEESLKAEIDSLINPQMQTVTSQGSASLAELGQAKEKVGTNKASSLRDLESDMRNQLTAGSQYLGGIPGASNSTAPRQYSEALTKAGSKNRAGILKQANELSSNIDLQINKVKQTTQDEMSKLQAWKNSELMKISTFIQQQRGQIDSYKAQYIANALQQLDQRAQSFRDSLSQWAMNNSTTLEGLKQKMAQMGQFDVPQISQGTLPGMQLGQSTNGQDYTGLWGSPKKQVGSF